MLSAKTYFDIFFIHFFEHTYFVNLLSLCYSHNEKHTGYALEL